MNQYFNYVLRRDGSPEIGASVLVQNAPSGSTASIFASDGVTPLANPVTTDSTGYFEFYAAQGNYYLVITAAGIITDTVPVYIPNSGPAGTAATIAAGTTTTGAAGTNASVTNSGTSSAAIFDFTIPRGNTGAAGTNGTNGTNGATWRDGSGVPSNSLGVNGDYYLDDATGNVYLKAAGTYAIVANIKGSTGNTGSAGAPGSVWRDGSGVPSNSLGVDGDYYLDDANGDVYYKSTGTYSLVANIKGPAGSGSVSTVSVVSANGFAGTVANPTTTPAITISTSITGVLKGNGTAVSAATSGTDYSAGTSGLSTGIVKSTTTTGALTIAVAGDFPTLNQDTTGSAAKWTTARNLAGNSVDGSVNVAFANKFIVQGTADSGLSAAQFLGALATGIVKNTTTTGVLSIAVAGDFPTLNQSTTGSAATLTTARAIYGNNFDGSAALTQIIASTYGGTGNGFAKFSGPATSEKTFTLPNASATVLTDNALVTSAQGGTANGFTKFSGPASTEKTFTLPNASATVLTDNAAVTAAQGGTGLATLTAHNVMIGNGTGNVLFVAPGSNGNVLTSNGTDWTSAAAAGGGGGLVLLATLTPTVAAALNSLSICSATYNRYLIVGEAIFNSGAAESLLMRVATGGTLDTGSNYFRNGSHSSSVGTTGSTSFTITPTATVYNGGTGCSFWMEVLNVNDAVNHKSILNKSNYQSASTPGYITDSNGAAYTAANTISGFGFLWGSGGNFAAQGSIRIYGVVNS